LYALEKKDAIIVVVFDKPLTVSANLSENDNNVKLTGREDMFSSSSTSVGVKANSHHVAMLKFFSGTLGPSLGLIESHL